MCKRFIVEALESVYGEQPSLGFYSPWGGGGALGIGANLTDAEDGRWVPPLWGGGGWIRGEARRGAFRTPWQPPPSCPPPFPNPPLPQDRAASLWAVPGLRPSPKTPVK